MYQSKSLGRNTVCFFDPTVQAIATANATLTADLRTALQQQQFVVFYQPQFDRSRRMVSVEALLRWPHPQRGMVGPSEFIPAAEETGLILPLGLWVLIQACEQLAAWAHRPETAQLSIAVNVSARQFRHPDFVDSVVAAVQSSGCRADCLKIELTESLLADNMDSAIAKMNTLKALGVTLAPPTVDTAENRQKLCRGHVQQPERSGYFQGYLLCPPLPLDELNSFLRNHLVSGALSQ